MLIVFLTP